MRNNSVVLTCSNVQKDYNCLPSYHLIPFLSHSSFSVSSFPTCFSFLFIQNKIFVLFPKGRTNTDDHRYDAAWRICSC